MKTLLCLAFTLFFIADGAAAIIAGIDYNYPPHEFVEKGKARGFNVDIIKAIAEEMGSEIEFKPMTWCEAKEALKNGSIDILCMAENEERKQYFSFSKPILDLKLAIFVNAEITGIADIYDLEGHSVVVEKGDIAEEILQQKKINAYIIEANNQDDAMKLLARKEATTFFGNYYTGIYLIHKYGYKNIKIIGEAIDIGKRVIAVKKGNYMLLDAINESIDAIMESGKYDEIYEKWYGLHVYTAKKLPSWVFLAIFGLIAAIAGGFSILSLWNRALIKKVEERTSELIEYKRQLEEKVKGRTEELRALIFALAHDLKAPLRSIKAFASILLNEQELNEEGKDALQRILNAGERMEMLIGNLLEYGRMEMKEARIEKIDVNEIVEEVINEMQAFINERKAEIKIGKLPPVRGDRDIMKRVMHNLIHNAVKFVERGKKPVVEIYGEKNDVAKIFIKDNGIGIPKGREREIFALFAKLHGREEYAGVGIGLAMVKKGVEMMGGRVGVRSEEGKGSIFWVELPL